MSSIVSPPPHANSFIIGTAVINTHPGVLGSIHKQGKQDRGTVCGRCLLAWTRGRPTATDVGSLSHPYHITCSYCSLARPPHTHSLVLVTAISRMLAGPMVRATFWSSKLSTRVVLYCSDLRSHSFTQAGPWIIATQPGRNTLSRRDLGF